MRIRVLVENTTDSELISEHGLSLWIEYKGKRYLLDAGSSGVFLTNAKALNEPVEQADYCILSHGHYDHAGGFAAYFRENREAKVYAMCSAVGDYHSASGGELHYIGIPAEVFPAYEEQFVFIDRVTCLEEGVYLIPHRTEGLEAIGARSKLYRRGKGEYLPDDFSHELSLVFDTGTELLVFNSCSHAGIINILKEVKAVLPDKRVAVFCGGLHMKGTRNGEEYCTFTENEIEQMAEQIKEEGVKRLYTGHCTGGVGRRLLEKYLPGTVEGLITGKEIIYESAENIGERHE